MMVPTGEPHEEALKDRCALCLTRSASHPTTRVNRSWRPLCEPDADFAQLLTFPLAFVAGTAILVLWLVLAPFAPVSPGFVQILCVFAALVPLHELTHAATFPQRAPAGHSTLAFSPLRLKLCAEYDGTLSRTRLVTSLVMPLLVISLLPVLVCCPARARLHERSRCCR